MPIDFNKYPYYDDFTKDNLYYRMLFQPGRAVQARELTQIQTMLQNQISEFGRHIFKDGAKIVGGRINYDKSKTKWLAVQSQSMQGNPVRIRDMLPEYKIRKTLQADSVGTDNEVQGTIVKTIPAEASDPNTIYFTWDRGGPDSDGPGFGANEPVIIVEPISGITRYSARTLQLDSGNNPVHYGSASTLSVEPGVYFWKGIFVQFAGGSISLSKYSSATTYRIGLAVSEGVERSDPRSLDPAAGSNYGAPGADRYRIELSLTKIGNGVIFNETFAPNFIEIGRIENGNLLESDDGLGISIYNILGQRLARRTYEESGNYVVRPFKLKVTNKTTPDNPKMVAQMSEGVAYVKGYRHSVNRQTSLEIDKGRDVLREGDENLSNDYGDNYVLVYDHANTDITHPENANGLFVVGSDASEFGTTDAFGQRGAAVSIHSVPHEMVKNHSLSGPDAWKSTLVGTARPMQMAYDGGASAESHRQGRPGDVYALWLGDFNSVAHSNTIGCTNIIRNVSAYSNTGWSVFHFDSVTHGITANDRFSIAGDSNWEADYWKVDAANSIAIMANTDALSSVTAHTARGLTLYRTTGNNAAERTVVLDEDSSAAWNDSYVGATISVSDGSTTPVYSAPRKIIGYVGTDSRAETRYDQRHGWSKRATVIVDKDLGIIPEIGNSYKLNLTMKQARSVVYNTNISADGTNQFPVTLNQMWNIDPISGVIGGDIGTLNQTFTGNRIEGDCTYNQYGGSVDGEDALLFPTGRAATKSLVTDGNLEDGFTSNTDIRYTEYSVVAGDGNPTLVFNTAAGGNDYRFFAERPISYPFSEPSTITDLNEIQENFILANRTTGDVVTHKITKVEVGVGTLNQIKLTLLGNFTASQDYVLLFPAKAKFAEPAKKQRITGNSTFSITMPASQDLTDYDRGQVTIANATYGTTEGSRIVLAKPDGFRLNKVVKEVRSSAGNTDIANTQLDVTNHFDFDTGQRDMFYDNCSLVLKSDGDVTSVTGNLFVSFDYFKRTEQDGTTENLNAPGYFGVDSYQYTTDVTMTDRTGDFKVGDRVVANGSGAHAYVLDHSATKLRLIDVTSPLGSTQKLAVNDFLIHGDVAGKISSITESQLRYSEIPVYRSKSNRPYPLRNMLDFRPYVSSTGRVSDTIADSMMMPIPTRAGIKAGKEGSGRMTTKVGYDHFAGRIDKIVLNADGSYSLIKGTGAVTPLPPKDEDSDKAMTLFNLHIPPYTLNPSNVQIVPNMAMRHTMKDIGRLAKRVENLEYYVSLNALENAAAGLDMAFDDGTPRFMNGIVVDNFSSHKIADSAKLKAAIGKGVLRPQSGTIEPDARFKRITWLGGQRPGTLHFKYDKTVSSGIVATGRRYLEPEVVMLNYSIKPLTQQRVATTTESVNPFNRQNWTGQLKLTPDKDSWIDTNMIPEYNAFFHEIHNLSNLEELSEDATDAEIAAHVATLAERMMNMDRFWTALSGVNYESESIVGTATHTPNDPMGESGGGTHHDEINISLGSNWVGGYTNTVEIDAAIALHGTTDGLAGNMDILPYIRSRDIVVQASALRPNHLAALLFENVGAERWFSPATEIYMSRTSSAKFLPQQNDEYERITLTGTGGRKANAVLLAVRDPIYRDSTITSGNIKIGYIVPDFNEETGKVDWANYKDGFYNSAWIEGSDHIKQGGFQGSAARTIAGVTSEATADLVTDGTAALYNGHYTGTARNTVAGNTTHILLSSDASRYVADNFRKDDISITTGLPFGCVIGIVAGTGAGQECMANNWVGTEGAGSWPVIELKGDAQGKTGLTTGIDSTSVYKIGMRPVNPDRRSQGISQIGHHGRNTNHYGDKLGLLHIPARQETSWTSGRKLVEVMDRFSKQEWLVTSYASSYYFAEGYEREEVEAPAIRLEVLQDVRSLLKSWDIDGEEHVEVDYIPARNNHGGAEGMLAVVTGFDSLANGHWTAEATDGEAFVLGDAHYGDVSEADADALAVTLSGVWDEIRRLNPDIFERYYAHVAAQWGIR